ncbi:hypothetical protein dsx2_0095 [Desulfovibrio sp. X2]|uniref:hypothetical protein n=1 Tax=Desulfovibrio sp. X2 TaxID=941449 RepID=UPI0003589049|nr:hypothetical protein [Desulfovibrio sp. X2]EPR43871.1 hypothetical protein dsx2_0095 [Desulfovibrio sp. X2]
MTSSLSSLSLLSCEEREFLARHLARLLKDSAAPAGDALPAAMPPLFADYLRLYRAVLVN